MNPIETALSRIQKDPDHPSSKVLCSLLLALDTGESFSLKQLYNVLSYKDFHLSLEVMREWRLEEMRVKKGELTQAVTHPASCLSIWSRLRENAFAALGV